MGSLLCNWFEDWGRSIRDGLGHTGVIIFLVVFFSLAMLLFYGIIRNATITVKRKISWGYIVMLVIVILFFAWFCTIL
ncbi:MAG: hypothetical protein HFI85_03025 [Clostridia bacterium]|jgi:hypothetical protein|nr:hypothetical protein [Clostridia bacterium]